MHGLKPLRSPRGLRQIAVRGANDEFRLATGRSPTFSVKPRLVADLGHGGKSPALLNDYSSVSRMLSTARKLIAPATAM